MIGIVVGLIVVFSLIVAGLLYRMSQTGRKATLREAELETLFLSEYEKDMRSEREKALAVEQVSRFPCETPFFV